jgi:DNA-binding transcriptional regulator PaaX
MTLKQYAVRSKLSLFNVVKMVKSGELKSETVEENGKEVTYILADKSTVCMTKEAEAEKKPSLSNEALHELVLSLQEEVKRLRREMDHLKIGIGLK